MRESSTRRVNQKIGSLVGVAAAMAAFGIVQAEPTTKDLGKVSSREYLRLCALTENAHPCLQAVYTNVTVNRMLDIIKNRNSFCPPVTSDFPPADIVSRVTAWVASHPAVLDTRADEALSEALVAMYPCR